MLIFQFSLVTLFMTSSFAHLLNCISYRARHVCFSCDYSAILYYTVAAAMLHSSVVTTPVWEMLIVGPVWYLFICIVIGFWTLRVTCQTRLPNAKKVYLYRTLSFAIPFFTANYPIIYYVYQTESTSHARFWFNVHIYSLLIGAIFNVT